MKNDMKATQLPDEIQEIDFSAPKYGISELAKMLDLHPQTIRFFEKAGILTPDRKNSGIRKYSIHDAYLLQLRKSFEALGFSLAETKAMIEMQDLSEAKQRFSQAAEDLRESIEWKNYLLSGLEEQNYVLDHLECFYEKLHYRMRPAAWRHQHIVGTELCRDSDSNKARLEAVRLMPLARYSVRIEKQCILDNELSQFCCDVVLPEAAAVRYGFDKIPGSWYEPEQLCLYGVISFPALLAPAIQNCELMTSFAQQTHLALDGNVYCDYLVNYANRNGETCGLYEIWIPVASERE